MGKFVRGRDQAKVEAFYVTKENLESIEFAVGKKSMPKVMEYNVWMCREEESKDWKFIKDEEFVGEYQ